MFSSLKSFLPLSNIRITIDEICNIIIDNKNAIIMEFCALLITGALSRTMCDPDGNCKEIPFINSGNILMSKEYMIVYESHLNFEP